MGASKPHGPEPTVRRRPPKRLIEGIFDRLGFYLVGDEINKTLKRHGLSVAERGLEHRQHPPRGAAGLLVDRDALDHVVGRLALFLGNEVAESQSAAFRLVFRAFRAQPVRHLGIVRWPQVEERVAHLSLDERERQHRPVSPVTRDRRVDPRLDHPSPSGEDRPQERQRHFDAMMLAQGLAPRRSDSLDGRNVGKHLQQVKPGDIVTDCLAKRVQPPRAPQSVSATDAAGNPRPFARPVRAYKVAASGNRDCRRSASMTPTTDAA